MELFVVRCFMEGCEECGHEYHVVGVFSTMEKAEKAQADHEKFKHLHSFYVDIDKVVLDEEKRRDR